MDMRRMRKLKIMEVKSCWGGKSMSMQTEYKTNVNGCYRGQQEEPL